MKGLAMTPLLHRQPWKLLYFTYFVAKILLVKLPFWTLISLPRSQRPRPSWSITKCLHVYFMRCIIEFPIKLGVVAKRDLTVEVPNNTLRNAKFIWVEGIDEEGIQGEVRNYAKNAGTKATKIPGYWQFKDSKVAEESLQPKEDEKIVYHLHGGALYLGSAHPADATARIPRGIMKRSATVARTFAVDYRLCASAPFPAENQFPAALIDCISGYKYLITLGFLPKNIILAGDSAGGNLALAVVRYLVDNPTTGLAPPGKLLLMSPWGDIFSSRLQEPTSSLRTNARTDIFPLTQAQPTKSGFGGYGAKSYIGSALKLEEARGNMYIAPASPHLSNTTGMFKSFPKTYISVGGAERLLDDGKIIYERIKADNSFEGWVTLDVAKDAVHDFTIFPWCEREGSEALARIAAWIDQA